MSKKNCNFAPNIDAKEIWKDIEGYNGLYQVSSLGRVKSLERTFYSGKNFLIKKTHPERIMKLSFYNTGYVYVGLSKDGFVRKFKIHRLVATAFIPNPENKPCVDHLNAVRDDNRVENLHWVDASENMNNSHTLKAISITKLGNLNPMKLKQRPVLQIDPKTNEVVAEFIGCKEAARALGINSGNLSRCCRNPRYTYKGFIFRYK